MIMTTITYQIQEHVEYVDVNREFAGAWEAIGKIEKIVKLKTKRSQRYDNFVFI